MKGKFLIFLIFLGTTQSILFGIPTFARKYGFSCEVCHAPVPHLKSFGEKFLANGYQIPDKEPERAYKDTGDPLLLLQRELPLAIRFDGYLSYEPNSEIDTDIRSPFVMKILSGGNISKSISYYTYFLLSEEGKVGLEDGYISFNNVFNLPLSIVFGQYRVSDPIKPSELRLTFEDYKIYKFRVGHSTANLSYERGVMFNLSPKEGTELVFQVVNGSGIDTPEIFDKDRYKNISWRIAQGLENIRIGLTGYWGREGREGIVNNLSYLGPDLKIKMPKVELLIQFLKRWDTNPLFENNGKKYMTEAWLGEIIFSPYGENGRWFLIFLYNRIRSQYNPIDYQTSTFNISYLIRRNLKLMNELSYDLDKENHRFSTGIVVAF
ncbi:MAG: hypothetical protein ACUVUG_07445 [Candidatus Aminicenantia bacterium]